MTIHELIKVAEKKITNSTSPALDGEVLLSYVLDKPKEFLLAHPFKKVDPRSEKTYFRLVNKRLLGWPVAYLTKHKEFYNLQLYVDKHVLIPRPETEGLVELIIDTLKSEKRKLKIIDVGTGSGCIIIALAKNLRIKHLYHATDISPQAIKIAKKNAKIYRAKITFGDGNLLEPMRNEKFDVIVANLPYLAKLVDPSTKYEPIGALVAAKKGLKLYEELFQQIAFFSPPFKGETKRGSHKTSPSQLSAGREGGKFSLKGGEKLLPRYIFLEIGRDQGRPIKKLAARLLPEYQTKIYKDLHGRTRYALLKLK